MSDNDQKEIVVRLENVRLSFPHLAEPQVGDKGRKSYGALFMMEPDHVAVKKISAAIKDISKRKWPTKWEGILKTLKAAHKICLKPGELKSGDYPEFEGLVFVSANNGTKPKIFNRDAEKIQNNDGEFPYAGCYVNATVGIWPQDHVKHGKRINASLRGVQFVRDGEAFGGGTVASDDEFTPLAAGADDEIPEQDDEDSLV